MARLTEAAPRMTLPRALRSEALRLARSPLAAVHLVCGLAAGLACGEYFSVARWDPALGADAYAQFLGALMPLMGSPFLPGHAREYAASLDPGPRRDVALSELAYFTGDAAEAARLARPLLQATDGAARLSACLIFSYASLALGRINDARATLARARGALDEKTVGGGGIA